MSAKSVSEASAKLLAAYQSLDTARAATHAARVKVNELQSREAAAVDAVADAERQLAAAIETEAV